MDAIRKKMQSLKGETDSLHATIAKHEADAKATERIADHRARERRSKRGEASLQGLPAAQAITATNKQQTLRIRRAGVVT